MVTGTDPPGVTGNPVTSTIPPPPPPAAPFDTPAPPPPATTSTSTEVTPVGTVNVADPVAVKYCNAVPGRVDTGPLPGKRNPVSSIVVFLRVAI
jgi:hypothetical protein